MKLRATFGDERAEIELSRTNDIVSAIVDGRSYEMEVFEPEDNVFVIKIDNKIHRASVSHFREGTFIVNTRGRDIEIGLVDLKRLRGSADSGEMPEGQAEVKTAMPGKVVRILVATGDQVAKGDGVLVVEAMKMQNELKAPRDGVVGAIKTSEGETVAAGDVLAVIDSRSGVV
ncbi:MAG: biotin/lipoyl-containing protein [Pyrinomonadaceae bacterium]